MKDDYDVHRHSLSMWKAGESYIQTESSEHIRRALRHNVRTYADERYCNNDKVYYRRMNLQGWKVQVSYLVRTDSTSLFVIEVHIAYYRAQPYQLIKIHDARKLRYKYKDHQ